MKFLLYTLMLFTLCVSAERVRIYDTLGNEPVLRKAVMALAQEPDAPQYEISNVSTAEAAKALTAAQVEFVVCGSDNLPELEKKVLNLKSRRYASETLVVAVYITNSIDDIPLNFLREIFGGKVIAWRDFNGTGYMIDKVAPGEGVSGWFAFSRLVLKYQPPAKDVYLASKAGEPLVIASGRQHAMSCGIEQIRPDLRVKFLKVDGQNYQSGKYPLTLDYYLCWLNASPEKLTEKLQNP